MDQLLSPGVSRRLLHHWSSSFLFLEPRPDPRRSSHHDDPQGQPSETGTQRPPLSGLGASVACLCSQGQRKQHFKRGNGQLLRTWKEEVWKKTFFLQG